MAKKPFKNPLFSGGPKALLIGIVIMVGLLYLLTQLTDYARTMTDLSYKEFLDKVRTDQVKSIVINGPQVDGVFKDNQRFQATVAQRDSDFDLFEQHGVDYALTAPAVTSNLWYVLLLIGLLAILGAASAWYINRQGKNNGGQGGGLFTMGKSRAKIFMPNTIKEKFSSVAGAHEAKEELMDIVDFLKNPGKYRKIGAQIPRGVLLQGHPGTGKTLLARAVAGEAHCPFITVSGSDFVEVFVGVGASRVRDLFAQAKRNAPCIVFIDEIDAVGRQRSGGGHGGSDEREQTLNQLLTEMDGFEVNEEPIIVMAATNRADVLDKALLRPGRFDRIVTVPVPDLISREQILQVHLKKVKVVADIDVKKLARMTIGYTGADLSNFINTAAILATKAGLSEITMDQFEQARDDSGMGKVSKTTIMTEEEKVVTSYHEGGHTLLNILMGKLVSPLHKATITPRSGGSLGVTMFLPDREKHDDSKEEHLAYITVCMGGRAAEMLVFNKMASGARGDFTQATNIAYSMVTQRGMSEALGLAIYDMATVSEQTRTKIELEVAKILEEQYQRAYQLLSENRDKLEIIAKLLQEKEVVEAQEIYAALGMQAPQVVELVE
ncbi:MAG: ATP-dependent zinc metalloprotease FtsH [Candidatus Chromulinivorax sp.]